MTLQINGKDKYGVEKPLERRGTGIRRLLMVAFFEHMAEKAQANKENLIFGIEEPENGLHPGLQRDLVESFQKLVHQGSQIIVTTHSPVFAGSSPVDDLVLVVREDAVAKAIQKPALSLEVVAKELGVEPSDQIMGYRACVFVEGKDDVMFWQTIVKKFREGLIINSDFQEKNIGLIVVGGDNVKCWINLGTMKKLNKNFIVIKDSDKKKAEDEVCQTLRTWQVKCQQDGGDLIYTRKREIENYLHPRAIEASHRTLKPYDDFSDMKNLFGLNVIKEIEKMTVAEILEKDKYFEGETEHHELKEIAAKLLTLA